MGQAVDTSLVSRYEPRLQSILEPDFYEPLLFSFGFGVVVIGLASLLRFMMNLRMEPFMSPAVQSALLRWSNRQTAPVHYRKDLAESITQALNGVNRRRYVRVVGPAGVGKSTAIAGALAGRTVVRVTVPPHTTDSTSIVRSALEQVGERNIAAKAVESHRSLFKEPVVLILDVASSPLKPEGVAAAARDASELGFKVIVDCAHNVVDPCTDSFEHDTLVRCALATKTMIESNRKFAPFVGAAKAAGVADVFWAVIGGNPYEWDSCVDVAKDPRNVVESDLEAAWVRVLQPTLARASRSVRSFEHSHCGRESGAIAEYLAECDIVLLPDDVRVPFPNNVIHFDDAAMLPHCLPATPAVRFALRRAAHPEYKTEDFATLDDARAFVASIPPADPRVDGGGEWSAETAAAQPVNEKTTAWRR